MSYETARIAIDTYLKDNFHTYPIVPENFNYVPPISAVWIRYSLRPATSLSADVSATYVRRTGILWFQIFIPESKGMTDAMRIGDILAGLFDEVRLVVGDKLITFRRAELGFAGEDTSGAQMWRCTVAFKEESPAQIAA